MLDYKDIITKHYALGMSGGKIAESLKVSKSGAMTSSGYSGSARRSAIRYRRVLPITGLQRWFTEIVPSPVGGISATRCRTTRPWRKKCLPGRT